jgi:CTP synthase
VLTMHDVSNIWRVPLLMQSQDAHKTILSVLGLQHYSQHLDMHQWKVQIADRCGAHPCKPAGRPHVCLP